MPLTPGAEPTPAAAPVSRRRRSAIAIVLAAGLAASPAGVSPGPARAQVPSASTPEVAGVTVPTPSVPVPSLPVPTVPATPQASIPDALIPAPPDVKAPALPPPSLSVPDRSGPPPSDSTPAPQRSAASDRRSPGVAVAPRAGRTGEREDARRARNSPTPPGPSFVSAPGAAAARQDERGATRRTAAPAVALSSQRPPGLRGTVQDIVDALPDWVIGVFVAFAVIAALMAVNAYGPSRRARRLAAQRAALLDDVGLLQAALLATVPSYAGDAQISVAYRPADGPAAGGDFYDVVRLGPDRTGLLLGDVSGHGRESLTQAALVRYTLRTFLAAGHGPAEAVARADAILEADMDGHFATVIVAVYDHDRHTLRYAKAGHHPPLVLGAGDDRVVEAAALPLGVGFGVQPGEMELTLPAGATFCLFTDGLLEARRDGEFLGRDTIAALLADGAPDGPELLARVVAHADEVTDDLAVCLLRRP